MNMVRVPFFTAAFVLFRGAFVVSVILRVGLFPFCIADRNLLILYVC